MRTDHAAPVDCDRGDESNYGTDPVLAHGALLAALSIIRLDVPQKPRVNSVDMRFHWLIIAVWL